MRNYTAKYMNKYNKPVTHRDKKKCIKGGYIKHKSAHQKGKDAYPNHT